MNGHQNDFPKWLLSIVNNVYELDVKSQKNGDSVNITRNVEKIKSALLEADIFYEDPIGQLYKETRTDLEATISGVGSNNLTVVEVLKPIIRHGKPSLSRVIQKGIVIVEESKLDGAK